MSRIGRMPVTIPSGVDVSIDGRDVVVKGPKGTLQHTVAAPIEVSQTDGVLTVTRPNDEGEVRALHGLSRSLIANMVTGVTQGYTKTLEIVGVGYRVQAKGQNLEFSLGYSHPVVIKPPEGISFRVEAQGQGNIGHRSPSPHYYFAGILVHHADDEVRGAFVQCRGMRCPLYQRGNDLGIMITGPKGRCSVRGTTREIAPAPFVTEFSIE